MKKSKLTELLTTLYTKHKNNNVSEIYKSQIKQIVKEEIERVSVALDKGEVFEESNIPSPIQNLIDTMIANKIQRKTVTITDVKKHTRFMKDAKPAIKSKLLIIKHNPIDNSEMFISLGTNAIKMMNSLEEESKRDYKDEYKKFQSSDKSKKYRAELNKYNRDKGTYGNGDGKDASHKGGKIVGFESESKNRGRKEKSRLKKTK